MFMVEEKLEIKLRASGLPFGFGSQRAYFSNLLKSHGQ